MFYKAPIAIQCDRHRLLWAAGMFANSTKRQRVGGGSDMTSLSSDVALSMAVARSPVLTFEHPAKSSNADLLIIAGCKKHLSDQKFINNLPYNLQDSPWSELVNSAQTGDAGQNSSSLDRRQGGWRRLTAAVLPDICSRHNTPFHASALTELIRTASASFESRDIQIVMVLENAKHAAGAGCAIARAYQAYSLKNISPLIRGSEAPTPTRVSIGFVCATCADSTAIDYRAVGLAADGVRLAARLVDAPPEQLTTTAFVSEATQCVERLRADGHAIEMRTIQGTELRDKGYGGLWGVGKAAEEPPALVVLSHFPESRQPTQATDKVVCLVGKGASSGYPTRATLPLDVAAAVTAPRRGRCSALRAPTHRTLPRLHRHRLRHRWARAQTKAGHGRDEGRLWRGRRAARGLPSGCGHRHGWHRAAFAAVPRGERDRARRAA